MKKKQITFTIDEQGEMQIAIEGFVGKTCDAVLEQVQTILGKPATVTNTAEYRERPVNLTIKQTT